MFWRKIFHIGLLSSLTFESVFSSREVFSKIRKKSQFIDSRRIIQDSWQTTGFAPNYQTSDFSYDRNRHPNGTKYLGYIMPYLKHVNSYHGSHSSGSTYGSESGFLADGIIRRKKPASTSSKGSSFRKVSYNRGSSKIPDGRLQRTKHAKYEKSKVSLSSSKKKPYHKVHKPYVMHKYPAKKTVFPNGLSSPSQKYPTSSFRGGEHDSRKKTKDREYLGDLNSFDVTAQSDGDYDDRNSTTTGQKNRRDSFSESTTRGYYGDRIYMNTVAPRKILKYSPKNVNVLVAPKK